MRSDTLKQNAEWRAAEDFWLRECEKYGSASRQAKGAYESMVRVERELDEVQASGGASD
jgi:hypothetical protein